MGRLMIDAARLETFGSHATLYVALDVETRKMIGSVVSDEGGFVAVRELLKRCSYWGFPHVIQVDGSPEFASEALAAYLVGYGVRLEVRQPHAPWKAAAERAIRSLVSPQYDDALSYRRGSTLCGSASFEDDDGNPAAMLCICTAPEIAWAEGQTGPWDTCIFFSDRAGAKTAWRVARWLLRGDPCAPLLIEGGICLHVGEQHAELPCWRRLAEAVPPLFPWARGAA